MMSACEGALEEILHVLRDTALRNNPNDAILAYFKTAEKALKLQSQVRREVASLLDNMTDSGFGG